MSDSEAITAGERFRDLLSGSAKPPNEFVAYHVEQARAAQAEHEAVVHAAAKANQQLAGLRQRAIMLRAQLEAHLQSIAAWDSENGEATAGGTPAL